jgi:hypothetical protein
VAVTDINNDGALDLVTANYGSGTVSVLAGNGNGSFKAKQDYATGAPNPLSVTTADLNGDGFPDIVDTNFKTNTVSVLLNRGDGTASPHSVPARRHQPARGFPSTAATLAPVATAADPATALPLPAIDAVHAIPRPMIEETPLPPTPVRDAPHGVIRPHHQPDDLLGANLLLTSSSTG